MSPDARVAPWSAGLALLFWAGLPSAVQAHDFTAALLVLGEDRELRLAEAVRGFLLAADERDGHDAETSDGHLGGVDVHVLPLPRAAAGLVEGLSGAPDDPPDIVVVIASAPDADTAGEVDPDASLVISPGVLPAGWEADTTAEGFAARYRKAFGTVPGEAAALGYHAARRLDAAIRPLDGVSRRGALAAELRATESRFDW